MTLTKEKLQAKFSTRRLLVPILIGLSVIAYMFYQNYESVQVQSFSEINPMWLIIALLLLIMRDYGYMHRIRYVTDKKLSWKNSFQVIMLWEFASCALPSVVGGSTVAAYILAKEGISLGKSIAQVMVTAMLDNLYFVFAVPIVLIIIDQQILLDLTSINESLKNSLKIAFGISYSLIALYAFFMFYALIVCPELVTRNLLKIGDIRFLSKWQHHIKRHANELLNASKHLRTKSWSYWIHASASTFIVWTARYAIIGCIVAAFTHLSIHDQFVVFARNLIYKVVLLVSVTPGGAGFAELAFPAFFGAYIGGFTITVILLYRILTYYLYLVAGLLVFPRWVTRVYRNEPLLNTSDFSIKSNSAVHLQMNVNKSQYE